MISLESIALLTSSVKNYLTLHKRLFPHETITPKQHYLIHFPQQIMTVGPLAKHMYLKSLKKTCNFKNIALSLSRRHQNGYELKYGPQIHYQATEREALREQMAEVVGCRSEVTITKIKWVKIHGTKYLHNECYMVINKDGENLPQLAKIIGIFSSQLAMQHFDKNMNAYYVTLPSTNDPICHDVMQKVLLIPDALQTFTFQAKMYINVKE